MSSSVLPPNGGLVSNAYAILQTVIKLAGVRVSLALMEFSDARDTLFRVLLLGTLALLGLVFALLSISGMIVMLAWETLGWRIFLILFLVYFLMTIALLCKAHSLIASGKIGFPLTLSELKKDRDALFDQQFDQDCGV
jgi:uncharacterized membrane protein YqjE